MFTSAIVVTEIVATGDTVAVMPLLAANETAVALPFVRDTDGPFVSEKLISIRC